MYCIALDLNNFGIYGVLSPFLLVTDVTLFNMIQGSGNSSSCVVGAHLK